MILFLCYVCPPVAVFMMGRPFSAMLNMFLCCWFWLPGVRHALVQYADYKTENHVSGLLGAINAPKWASPAKQLDEPRETRRYIDDPGVGENGTRFRKRL